VTPQLNSELGILSLHTQSDKQSNTNIHTHSKTPLKK